MKQTPKLGTLTQPTIHHTVKIAPSVGSGSHAAPESETKLRQAKPVLLRQVIGDQLRARRTLQGRTLREVSRSAQVSLGYLSEVERGHKEASSELLAAICFALNAPLHDVLIDVAADLARRERAFDTVVS
jgi:hypothetical protein